MQTATKITRGIGSFSMQGIFLLRAIEVDQGKDKDSQNLVIMSCHNEFEDNTGLSSRVQLLLLDSKLFFFSSSFLVKLQNTVWPTTLNTLEFVITH